MGPKHTQELLVLDNLITETEILSTINEMSNDKASGPDGLPVEFYKSFWQIVKNDLTHLIAAFYTDTGNIKALNKATITLIPKKETPIRLADYRPINVINTVIKIITKVLANRLQNFLQVLVSPNQTAFVRGRSMMESFLSA